MVKADLFTRVWFSSDNDLQVLAALTDYLLIWCLILIFKKQMAQQKRNNINKGSAVGVIIGVGMGILVTLIFRKVGYGILMGIIVALLLRRSFK